MEEKSVVNTKEDDSTQKKRVVRKARIQVEKQSGPQFQREEGGMDYNLWYHSYLGHKRDRFGVELEPAKTRCSISKDSGWSVGCTQKDPYFCLYFARGACSQGPDCKFMHRLPTKSDEARIPITKDCFGRDKHASDREDMSGVGSFNKDCKTLYITNLKNLGEQDMTEMITRHFKEWGKLEFVRVYAERCFAFVRYELRLCAEFAKVAMSNQTLDSGEVLNVKWSQEDQNPMAQSRDILEKKQKLIHNMEQKGIDTKNLEFSYPTGYQVPNPKEINEKLKQIEGSVNESEAKPEDMKSLDFTKYMHETFKQARFEEKKQEDVQRLYTEQKEKLGSSVAAPYPDTDKQFYHHFSKQLSGTQKQGSVRKPGQSGDVDLSFYTTYDPVVYQQFSKNEEKKK